MFVIVVSLTLVYVFFWFWYGGNGQPMTPQEIEEALGKLQSTDPDRDNSAEIQDLRDLLASDDGKEFVMQNLVRYRAKALYPEALTSATTLVRPTNAMANPSSVTYCAMAIWSFLSPENRGILSRPMALINGTMWPWCDIGVDAILCGLPPAPIKLTNSCTNGPPLKKRTYFQSNLSSVYLL